MNHYLTYVSPHGIYLSTHQSKLLLFLVVDGVVHSLSLRVANINHLYLLRGGSPHRQEGVSAKKEGGCSKFCPILQVVWPVFNHILMDEVSLQPEWMLAPRDVQ